ncbi:MAG TPA: hypothetical protein VK171_06465 [Fimbriimonas sp.]|nr:hypothetical protein [Fimbriimonas sp.]
MTLALSTLISVLSVAQGGLTPSKPADLIDQLKPFEGQWKGEFKSGTTKMDIDMTWKAFGGHWSEVSYTYSTPQFKLEYRVLMTANKENTGISVWSFGNDAKVPEEMTGKMDGSTLVVNRGGKDPFNLKFSLTEDKKLIMSLVTKTDAKEIARGELTKTK